jgi:hypothetical protein
MYTEEIWRLRPKAQADSQPVFSCLYRNSIRVFPLVRLIDPALSMGGINILYTQSHISSPWMCDMHVRPSFNGNLSNPDSLRKTNQ